MILQCGLIGRENNSNHKHTFFQNRKKIDFVHLISVVESGGGFALYIVHARSSHLVHDRL